MFRQMGMYGWTLQVLPDLKALASAAADLFILQAAAAVASRGRFCAALSGGSTPAALFQQLRTPATLRKIDWPRVHLFWGDERCVPADHPESNYQMARQTLLDYVPIPARNLHRIPAEVGAEAAAAAYEETLRTFFGVESWPLFDLMLLGLGEDGHTASLFPGSPALLEKDHWTAAVEHHTPPPPLVDRVSLTLPVINAARQAVFLVSGAGKAEILARVLHPLGAEDLCLPAQHVRLPEGQLTWLVDRAAAGKLD